MSRLAVLGPTRMSRRRYTATVTAPMEEYIRRTMARSKRAAGGPWPHGPRSQRFHFTTTRENIIPAGRNRRTARSLDAVPALLALDLSVIFVFGIGSCVLR